MSMRCITAILSSTSIDTVCGVMQTNSFNGLILITISAATASNLLVITTGVVLCQVCLVVLFPMKSSSKLQILLLGLDIGMPVTFTT